MIKGNCHGWEIALAHTVERPPEGPGSDEEEGPSSEFERPAPASPHFDSSPSLSSSLSVACPPPEQPRGLFLSLRWTTPKSTAATRTEAARTPTAMPAISAALRDLEALPPPPTDPSLPATPPLPPPPDGAGETPPDGAVEDGPLPLGVFCCVLPGIRLQYPDLNTDCERSAGTANNEAPDHELLFQPHSPPSRRCRLPAAVCLEPESSQSCTECPPRPPTPPPHRAERSQSWPASSPRRQRPDCSQGQKEFRFRLDAPEDTCTLGCKISLSFIPINKEHFSRH